MADERPSLEFKAASIYPDHLARSLSARQARITAGSSRYGTTPQTGLIWRRQPRPKLLLVHSPDGSALIG